LLAIASCSQKQISHELREFRVPADARRGEKDRVKRNGKKQPGRENSKEERLFFDVFAQLVFAVSLPFTCLVVFA